MTEFPGADAVGPPDAPGNQYLPGESGPEILAGWLTPEAADRIAAQLAQPTAPGPKRRVLRTVFQVVTGVVMSIPAVHAALVNAGVEIDPEVTALVLGIPAVFAVVVAGIQNAIGQARGKG